MNSFQTEEGEGRDGEPRPSPAHPSLKGWAQKRKQSKKLPLVLAESSKISSMLEMQISEGFSRWGFISCFLKVGLQFRPEVKSSLLVCLAKVTHPESIPLQL